MLIFNRDSGVYTKFKNHVIDEMNISNSRVTGRVDALATRQTKTLRPSPPLSGRPVRRGEGQNDSLFGPTAEYYL